MAQDALQREVKKPTRVYDMALEGEYGGLLRFVDGHAFASIAGCSSVNVYAVYVYGIAVFSVF